MLINFSHMHMTYHDAWSSVFTERRSMGSAPYIGPRLGGGPTFEVSMLHLDAIEHPGKLPTLSS